MNNLEKELEIFRSEVTTLSQSFFTWKTIHDIATRDEGIKHALNANALSWNIILYSLQNTFLITLSRLFDEDSNSFSVYAFLNSCIKNIDQFEKANLRNRKLRNLEEKNPAWLDEYINEAYVPTKEELGRIKKQMSRLLKSQYGDTYRPIRNKVIAHKDKASIGNQEELFEKTDIEHIEEFIYQLVQIQEIVFQLLYNGILTSIGDHKIVEGEYVIKDVQALMERIRSKALLS